MSSCADSTPIGTPDLNGFERFLAHRKVRSTKLEATALRMNQLRASWFTRQSARDCRCLGMFCWETNELAWSGFVDHLFLPLTSKCQNTSNNVRFTFCSLQRCSKMGMVQGLFMPTVCYFLECAAFTSDFDDHQAARD